MIRHYYLDSVGDHELRVEAPLLQVVVLVDELVDIERNAVTDYVYNVLVAYTGRHEMQSESAVFVDDGVSCVGTALESDDYIRIAGQKVRDLALSFIAPVCAYNCLDHV